jgi:biopolymer transport protein ExbB
MAPSAVLSRSRLLALLLGSLAVFFVVGSVRELAPVAQAQEGEGAGSGESSSSSAKPEPKKPNLFRHILESVGIFFGIILLFVSIALVAIIVLLAMELRLGAAVPPGFVEDFTETVNKRRFKEAYEMAKEDSSFLGRVLTAGMARLQYGIEDAREAALGMVESIKASKEQLVTYLATIGTLGPMLGLVGTVWGMILAFMELATATGPVEPAKLAGAISHALVVTLLGIALSVPAIFCHAFFRNRLIRLAHDTSNVADDLLTQMYHNSKKAPTASTTPVEVAAEGRAVPAASIKQK